MDKEKIAGMFRFYLRSSNFFSELSQENFKYLYSHFLPQSGKRKDCNYYFEPTDEGLVWLGDYSLKLTQDERMRVLCQFECDIIVNALMHINLTEKKNDLKKIQLHLTVRAFAYPNAELDFINGIKEYMLWTPEQKIINHFNELIFKKYREFDLKSLGYRQGEDKFELLTRIWPDIDKTYEKQLYVSSYYYFQEIDDSYDQIRFLLTNARLYSQHTSNYTGNPIDRPESDRYYDMILTLYDRRYLDFCSMTFERIYAFWEKIAFLLFQYIKPVSLDKSKKLVINDENLSLVKLIGQLKKEVKKNHHAFLISSPSFDWFKNFVNGTHKKLCNHRHPLIHFRLDDIEIGKGNRYTYTKVFWMKNIHDKAKLEKLQKENESLLPFLNEQFKQCEIGLDKAVQLIMEIQKAKK